MKLRCVIVDDEPLAISILEGFLKKLPNIQVVATFNDAISVIDFLSENQIDFIFLDIEMPNLTGIDFLKSMPNPPLAIIISANKNYAIEGYDLSVVDYLLKPISLERVIKAVNKLVDHKRVKPDNPQHDLPNHLFIKENKKMVRVPINGILYLESVKDYVKIVTKEREIVTKQNLCFFEETLKTHDFIRVHRSFIVSLSHVDAYSCSAVEIGKAEIPMGRHFKEAALKKLGVDIEME